MSPRTASRSRGRPATPAAAARSAEPRSKARPRARRPGRRCWGCLRSWAAGFGLEVEQKVELGRRQPVAGPTPDPARGCKVHAQHAGRSEKLMRQRVGVGGPDQDEIIAIELAQKLDDQI